MANDATLPRLTTRSPVAVRIAHAEKKLKDLDERIGRLMTQRVDMEEKLAEMYRLRNRMSLEER